MFIKILTSGSSRQPFAYDLLSSNNITIVNVAMLMFFVLGPEEYTHIYMYYIYILVTYLFYPKYEGWVEVYVQSCVHIYIAFVFSLYKANLGECFSSKTNFWFVCTDALDWQSSQRAELVRMKWHKLNGRVNIFD